SSRMAWRQGPQGSKQHLDLAAAATRARTQRPRKYLAIHAAKLAIEPNFQILRRYRRSLLLRLEHAHRAAVENHVHRAPRLGSRRSLNLRIGITLYLCCSRLTRPGGSSQTMTRHQFAACARVETQPLISCDLASARASIQMREHLLDMHDVGVFVMQIEQIDLVADQRTVVGAFLDHDVMEAIGV